MLERRYLSPGWLKTAASAILLWGIAFIVLRSIIRPYPDVDFRFFWLGGYMWAHGLNPYGADYGSTSRLIFLTGNVPSAWVYPPHWWPICRFLALFGLKQAVMIWRLATGTIFIGGTWLVARTMFADRGPAAAYVAAAAAGVACLVEPTSMTLSLGQNAAFSYLGLCLLLTGFVRPTLWMPRLWINVLAILLLSLKPQIGLPIIVALLFLKPYRLPFVLAVLAGLIMSLPQLLAFGPIATATQLLGNLSGYSGRGLSPLANPNSPVSCTGVLNLIGHFASDLTIAPGYIAGLAGSLAVGCMMLGKEKSAQLEWLTLLIALVYAIVPLHSYDMTALVLVSVMLFSFRADLGIVSLAAIAMLLRPSKIERFFGDPIASGAVGDSLAAVLLMVLVVFLLSNKAKMVPPTGAVTA